MRTVTQTVTQTRRARTEHITIRNAPKVGLDPSPDDEDPEFDNSPSNPNTADVAPLECHQFVRVLCVVRTLKDHGRIKANTMVRPARDGKRGKSYKLVYTKEHLLSALQDVLDPAEIAAYETILYEVRDGTPLAVWDRPNKVPMEMYLVRCKGDAHRMEGMLRWATRSEITTEANRHALNLYHVREILRKASNPVADIPEELRAKTMKNRVPPRVYHTLIRMEQKAVKLAEDLAKCETYGQCMQKLYRACGEPSLHPDVLKAIHKYATNAKMPSTMAWDEICTFHGRGENSAVQPNTIIAPKKSVRTLPSPKHQ